MTLTIGVDVGGTKIAAGVVNEDGEILAISRKPTPAQNAQLSVQTIIDVINDLKKSYDVEAVGIGAPGFIDNSRSSVILAPNMCWQNEPLAMKVAQAVSLPVFLENDANAAAWGEYRFGAAKGRSSAITVTVGTGIGGGVIMEGNLLRGSYGFAAEIGHMNMVPEGLLCGCGENGCWEMYASGNALVRLAKERATKSPALAQRMLELAEGNIDAINGYTVTQAAQDGDVASRDCFQDLGRWLGQGIADLAAIFDPEVFVLSGGVSEAGDLLLAPVRNAFEMRLTARTLRPLPSMVIAKLGNQAGLIGAANLALQ
ncbi:glucokinase [Arcanobacterium pluranimalium]|uniref:ROK family glucokinase n=1 Tax=Arcanobacterium pluranimalium TaxID=108028 RepID=UPI00195D23AF|nr:ROK family glucokinase [Arcanobacterium pluranimalium]MBM7824276.1 glucokinase [Arcanobacterium pluranimalium]